MKRSGEIVDTRRKRILEILNKTGDVRVPDVASHLKVSEITIRRDLQFLEDSGLIERYYGGARFHKEKMTEKDELALSRKALAAYAASLISDGDTIFINTSGTVLRMLEYIKARDVTVITNNANAVAIPKSHTVTVILTGGELYNLKGTLVGDFAYNNINKVTAKKSFIGCSGLSMENGMTTEILNEVVLNRAMMTRTMGETYIIADHTKIGNNSSFVSCELENIHNVITDSLADPSQIEAMRSKGIHVDLADIHATAQL